MWRAAPTGVVALLVGCVTTAALVLFNAACAKLPGSASLSATNTVKPRVITGEKQTFTIRVTDHRGDTARDVAIRNPLPDDVCKIPGGPVAELASVERSTTSRAVCK
jgi:uncharacterized protein (DUF58 family)